MKFGMWALLLFISLWISSCSTEDPTPQEEPIPPRIAVPFPEAMYVQNGCAACHGMDGQGNGPKMSAWSTVSMPNFQNKNSYKQGNAKEDIESSIRTGVPGTLMKSYSYLRKEEREALASFIYNMQRK